VNLTSPAYGTVGTTIVSVTSTQVVGRVVIPADAMLGAWKAEVNTFNGGTVTRASAFSVTRVMPPTVSAFTPTYGYRGTVLSFMVKGTNFQGDGRTKVILTPPGQEDIPTVLSSVTSTQITGYAAIPDTAATGVWNANVTTIDGGSKALARAMTVY